MRKPAQAAGLGDLQGFIERGYAAFAAMRGGGGEFAVKGAAGGRRWRAAMASTGLGAAAGLPE